MRPCWNRRKVHRSRGVNQNNAIKRSPYVTSGDGIMRACLRCGGKFESSGPGNRICDGCKGKESVKYNDTDIE